MKRSCFKGAPGWTDADYVEHWKSKCIFNEQGCWLWQKFVHRNGYPGSSYRGKNGRVHRFMYQIHRGAPAPADWDVCHTCDNRRCINPLHLFAGPRLVNMIDMRNKGRGNNQKKTHCPQGHEYTPENTWICNRGWRSCRTCNREKGRREWANGNTARRHRERRERLRGFQLGKSASEGGK